MKKILGYFKPYKWQAALGPLFKLLEATFELLVPFVVAAIVDRGLGARVAGGYPDADKGFILGMCGLLAAFGLFGFLFAVLAQYFSARAATGVCAGVRKDLFCKVQSLSYKDIDKMGEATILTRMTSDVDKLQTGINLFLRLFLRSPFIVFGAMIMAFTVSPKAALTFVVTIPALSVVVFGVMAVSIKLFRRVQGKVDRVLCLTRENLSGTRVVRAFAGEEAAFAEFRETNGELTRLQRFTGRFSALLNPLTYVIINLSVLAIIWLGGIEVNIGALQQGEVIALYNYMSQILVELIKLANFIILITKAYACVGRINEVLDTPAGMPECDTAALATQTSDPRGTVELADVSVSYHGTGEYALSQISLKAKPGEVIGIIGGTGSGKSTLVNLIPRLYDVSRGAVLVDGRDVRAYKDPNELRFKIGLVPQKAELFAGTVRENLQFGKQDATDSELFEALDAAMAGDFVRAKEGGLDFMIEQAGRNLSGGQRQRLTIARALVRKPEILILDDSASALDLATDAALRASIATLPYHPTVFIVSQRTASISGADQILVLDDGKAVGLGTHEALLDSCAVYREIYDSQFRSEGVSA